MLLSLSKIKPGVRELRPYSLSVDRATVKINQNENPYDLPNTLKAEVIRRISARTWSRYPEFVPSGLLKRLSEFSAWPAQGILAGNGSNELIQALLMVTLGEGKTVLICEPTFALYRQISVVLGAEVKSIPLNYQLQFDLPELLEKVREARPDVTIICSPNNPTGCVIEDEQLVKLLGESSGLVVIDEAYHEFAGHSAATLLNDFTNLVVLRTFSKAMALAGARVGYLMTAPELAREIAKAVLPYNINVFSQTAAEVALEMYDSELRPLIGNIVAERERLFAELQKISGLTPVASHANFMVVRSRINPKRVFEELLERDILIRDVSSYPMLQDYFRVTVGTPVENDLLIKALREIFRSE
jgi:histidinol-phosphate aminotransferase